MIDKAMVNEQQCRLISERLKYLNFRKEYFKREFLTFSPENEIRLRAMLFSVAICHQTHSLINNKRNLVGWDYLEYVFTELGKKNSELLNPEYLATLQIEELVEKIKPLFASDSDPENCTLDRLEERAKFIIEVSQILNNKYGGKVGSLLEKSNGFLVNNGKGIYELLEQFPPFSDPLRKKSSVFIKMAMDANIVKIKDMENFEPTMDYHMQRVLLRTGCVEVIDKNLKEALLNKIKLDSDEEIRIASVKVIRKISELSGKDVSKIHDFFWPLGRSCCKEKMLCIDNTCDKNPCTFFIFVEMTHHKNCIFDGVCKGSRNNAYRTYWQPIVETHYY